MNRDKIIYRIELAEPLKADQEVVVTVESVYSHALQPYPREILQSERQFVRMYANAYLYAPYKSTTQITVFSLPSDKVESYTKQPKPVTQDAATVTYGPFGDIAPFSEVIISVLLVLILLCIIISNTIYFYLFFCCSILNSVIW